MITYTNNLGKNPLKTIATNDLLVNNIPTQVINPNHVDISINPPNTIRMQTNEHSKFKHLANSSQQVSETKSEEDFDKFSMKSIYYCMQIDTTPPILPIPLSLAIIVDDHSPILVNTSSQNASHTTNPTEKI